MKWINKGKQFDETARIICDSSTEYYLWGARETGEKFLDRNKEKLKIKGFIDSNVHMWGKKIKGMEVFSPEVLADDNGAKIILTMFSPKAVFEVYNMLKNKKRKINQDFFNFIVFERIYYYYKYQKLNLVNLDLILTNQCTLSCEKCLLNIPYMNKKYEYTFKEIKKCLDNIFQYVDWFEEIHLVGGEPLLYQDIEQIIEYLGEHYAKKIGELQIISNATIIPSDRLYKLLKKYNVRFVISDYTKSIDFFKSQKVEKIIDFLKEQDINMDIRTQREWNDYNGDGTSGSEAELTEFMEFCPCARKTITIENNFIYNCARQAAVVMGELFKRNSNDYLDIGISDENMKKFLFEFSLGCTELGYLTYCKNCFGQKMIYDRIVPAAKQLR